MFRLHSRSLRCDIPSRSEPMTDELNEPDESVHAVELALVRADESDKPTRGLGGADAAAARALAHIDSYDHTYQHVRADADI